jgi:hypothetical protein
MLDSDDSSDDNSLHHTIMKSVKNLNHIAKQLRYALIDTIHMMAYLIIM